MRRSARLAAKIENKAQQEPKVKKGRSDGKVSNIAIFDNGTMVEMFKFLNYCQLAKKSLVTKRFRDLIQNHRHSLARLRIRVCISKTLYSPNTPQSARKCNTPRFCVFGEKLSPEAYNEWVIRNQYSKQIPFEGQVAENQSTENLGNYSLSSYGYYKDSKSDIVLGVYTELNHEAWPAFQHFVRLLTDPFIYIYGMQLTSQTDFHNLLAEAMNPNQNRLQCNTLNLEAETNAQKFLAWAKNYALCCDVFRICNSNRSLIYDEELLDFFMTGVNCTRYVEISNYDLSKVIINFVQKFMDLKSCDEYQIVESVRGQVKKEVQELLKRDYAAFLLKETRGYQACNQTFEFVNNNIGKKLTVFLWLYS